VAPLHREIDGSLRYETSPASQTPCGSPPQRCVAEERREREREGGRKNGERRKEERGLMDVESPLSICVM
jgi:hypothetical protein